MAQQRLAANIAATLHGERTRDYAHHSHGVVATLGLCNGTIQYKSIVITGPLAWIMHRATTCSRDRPGNGT